MTLTQNVPPQSTPTKANEPPTPPPPTAEFTQAEIHAIGKGELHLRPTRLVFAGGSREGGSYTLAGEKYGPETFSGSPFMRADLSRLDEWPEILTKERLNVPALFQAVADEFGACVVMFPDSVHGGKVDDFVHNLVLQDSKGSKKVSIEQIARLDKSNAYQRRLTIKGDLEPRLIGEPLLFASDHHSFIFIPRGERRGGISSAFSGIEWVFQDLKSREHLGINDLIVSGGHTGSLLVAGAYGATSGNWSEGGVALLPINASWNNVRGNDAESAAGTLNRWGIPVTADDFTLIPAGIFEPRLLYRRYQEIDDVIAQNGLYYVAGELDQLLKRLQVVIAPGDNYPDLQPYPFVTMPGIVYPSSSKVTQEALKRAGIALP